MKRINKFKYPTSMRSLIGGKRHYDVGKEKLPSVTTILKATESQEKQDSLAAWRSRVGEATAAKITEESSSRGTAMHKILEKYI